MSVMGQWEVPGGEASAFAGAMFCKLDSCRARASRAGRLGLYEYTYVECSVYETTKRSG